MNVRTLFLALMTALAATDCGGGDTVFYCGGGTSMPCDAKTHYCEVAYDAMLKATATCRPLPASCSGDNYCNTCLSDANIAGRDSCSSNPTGGSATAYLVSTSP